MIWLGYNKIKGEKVNKYFYKPVNYWVQNKNSQHHCYLIKYESIPKILKILLPIQNWFTSKDTTLKQNFKRFNAYFCNEKLAYQDIKKFPISERTGKKNA